MPHEIPAEILTHREGVIVRTRVIFDGREGKLPWTVECFTHSGARRKARRTIRHWRNAADPKRIAA